MADDVELVRQAVERSLEAGSAKASWVWKMDEAKTEGFGDSLGGKALAWFAKRSMSFAPRMWLDLGRRSSFAVEGRRSVGSSTYGPSTMLHMCAVPVSARPAGEVMVKLRPCRRFLCEVDAVSAAQLLGVTLPLPKGLTSATVRAMATEFAIDADGFVRRLRAPGAHADRDTLDDIEYGVALPDPWPPMAKDRRHPALFEPLASPSTEALAAVQEALARAVDVDELVVRKRIDEHPAEGMSDSVAGRLFAAGIDRLSEAGIRRAERKAGVEIDRGLVERLMAEGTDQRLDLVNGTEKAVAFTPRHPFADDRSTPGPHSIGGLWAIDALACAVAADSADSDGTCRVQVDLLRATRPLALPGLHMDTDRARAFVLRVKLTADGQIAEIVVPTSAMDTRIVFRT